MKLNFEEEHFRCVKNYPFDKKSTQVTNVQLIQIPQKAKRLKLLTNETHLHTKISNAYLK